MLGVLRRQRRPFKRLTDDELALLAYYVECCAGAAHERNWPLEEDVSLVTALANEHRSRGLEVGWYPTTEPVDTWLAYLEVPC